MKIYHRKTQVLENSISQISLFSFFFTTFSIRRGSQGDSGWKLEFDECVKYEYPHVSHSFKSDFNFSVFSMFFVISHWELQKHFCWNKNTRMMQKIYLTRNRSKKKILSLNKTKMTKRFYSHEFTENIHTSKSLYSKRKKCDMINKR